MSFEISASGLTAQRTRMNVIANNLANINTTRTPEGGPYRKRNVVFSTKSVKDSSFGTILSEMEKKIGNGVEVTEIVEDRSETAFIEVYDPTHPDADERGFYYRPNINAIHEMVDLIDASRAFEANVTAINAAKQMGQSALRIGST